MKRLRKKDAGQELDISPLIDVVFILLIFFMVSTTFQKDMQVELERPSAASATRASTKAMRIYIDRNQVMYVDEAPVKPWMLQSRVRDYLREAADGSVLIVTDRGVPAHRLIEAVDQCRLAGAADVGVITDVEEG